MMRAGLALALVAASSPTSDIVGRDTYRNGVADTPRGCASCHGLAGEGGNDAGQSIPRIAQIGYSDAELARLLATGVRRDGRVADLMPRYMMSGSDLKRLNAYLAVLGTDADVDPGVTPTRVLLRAILPLTGPRADEAKAMGDLMQRQVDLANASGGVHGRTVSLELVDVAAANDGQADDAFALIASPPSRRMADQPLIGALSPTPELADEASAPIFYLLPSTMADVDRLAQQLGDRRVGPYLAETAMVLTLRALSKTGRALNRARFVDAIGQLQPVVIEGSAKRAVRVSLFGGRHVASTELVAANE